MERHFPYRIAVEWSEEDGAYVARVPALPGCAAHGDTPEEAAREAIEAGEGILESMRAHGEVEPTADLGRSHSGNIRLRLPRYLHERLARSAEVEGVSLNALMVAILAQAGSGGTTPGELVRGVEKARARSSVKKPSVKKVLARVAARRAATKRRTLHS